MFDRCLSIHRGRKNDHRHLQYQFPCRCACGKVGLEILWMLISCDCDDHSWQRYRGTPFFSSHAIMRIFQRSGPGEEISATSWHEQFSQVAVSSTRRRECSALCCNFLSCARTKQSDRGEKLKSSNHKKSKKTAWGFSKMGSETLSQNRIYRCAPLRVTQCGLFFAIHRVVNVVIAPNAMIGEWRNCFESVPRANVQWWSQCMDGQSGSDGGGGGVWLEG